MMKSILKITFCIATFIATIQAYGQSYKTFVEQDSIFKVANLNFSDSKFTQAINNYSKIYQNVDKMFLSLLYSACSYMYLGNKVKALDCLNTAFEKGYTLKYVDYYDSLFEPIHDQIIERYNSIRPKYLNSVNADLRKEIKSMTGQDQSERKKLSATGANTENSNDSAWTAVKRTDKSNIVRLREILSQYGWPGFKLLGSNQTMGDLVDPSTIVIHSNEEDNLLFLTSAVDKATKGEASWHDAEAIMTNLLFRFYDEGHIKMRHTFFNENDKLDVDKSYLQLNMLASLIKDNPRYVVTFFCVRYPEEAESEIRSYLDVLRTLSQILYSLGVPPNAISINEQIKLVKDDKLGKYRIAFRRIKKLI